MENLYNILEEAQTVVSNCDDYPFQMNNQLNSQMGMEDYVQPLEATSSEVKPVARKSKSGSKKRSWKKPKDKPKRPLSAYNLFFQHERNNILAALPGDDSVMDDGLTEEQRRRKHRKTHGKIGFADLARSIADKWKNINPTERSVFEARADIEKQRYKKELDAWKITQGINGDTKSSSSRRRSKSKHAKSKTRMQIANPEALTSLMTVNSMNAQRTQMMQVLSNPLVGQQHQQHQQHLPQHPAVPRRNSNIHEQLMAQCAQNLMQHGNNTLPLSCLSQINSLQQMTDVNNNNNNNSVLNNTNNNNNGLINNNNNVVMNNNSNNNNNNNVLNNNALNNNQEQLNNSANNNTAHALSLQQRIIQSNNTVAHQHQLQLQLQQQLQQQQVLQQAVPDETFSKETFFEDSTDDDETYSGDDYYSGDSYSGDSYSGDSYDSSDDDLDARSTESSLEDDLNDFLCEFDKDLLFT